jgi:hypothetical protein
MRGLAMKTAAEYLDLALQFDLLATLEENPTLKADFEKQAAAYRKLAEARLEKTGLDSPKISNCGCTLRPSSTAL